jgi:phosphatidate cytidylyltransferase|tara:strand:+ start:177 stop:1064 length:888 start_codon:yes stop_codon:yes gene_type:complete
LESYDNSRSLQAYQVSGKYKVKHRLISSVIALPLVLGGIFLGGIWFSLIIIFGAVVSAYELARITGKNLRKEPLISAILSGLIVTFAQTYDGYISALPGINIELSASILPLVLLSFVSISILILLIWGRDRKLGSFTCVVSSVSYTGGLLSFAVLVRNSEFGFGLIVLLSLIVWANDTGSYIIGKAVGKTPFFPRISPHKTLEGAIGGYVCGLAVAMTSGLLLTRLGFIDLGLYSLITLGIVFVVLAQAGDLFESALKRRANLKDSGSIMPGHGGALDRLDSIVLAFPVLYYFAQ